MVKWHQYAMFRSWEDLIKYRANGPEKWTSNKWWRSSMRKNWFVLEWAWKKKT